MVGMAQGCGAKLVCGGSVQSFAAHLIAPGFKTPAIAKAHFLVSGTASVGLVRLAQQASRTRGFRTFALVVHGFLDSSGDKPSVSRALRASVSFGLTRCTTAFVVLPAA